MAAVLCKTCGKPIEGFVVSDPETGEAYHAGCVPKGFREEAKEQRAEARKFHVPYKTRQKLSRAVGKIEREIKTAQKRMALAGEAKDKVRETYDYLVENDKQAEADAALEKYGFSLTE